MKKFSVLISLVIVISFSIVTSQRSQKVKKVVVTTDIPCRSAIWEKIITYQAARKEVHRLYSDLQRGACTFKEWSIAVSKKDDAQRDLEDKGSEDLLCPRRGSF